MPYPGRTPHIHVKLRHPAFGEVTSQLFVAGEPGNAGDFLYRSLGDDDRRDVELRLQRAPAGAPVTWIAERDLLVGALRRRPSRSAGRRRRRSAASRASRSLFQ